MPDDSQKDKKGFSGLSDLASKVNLPDVTSKPPASQTPKPAEVTHKPPTRSTSDRAISGAPQSTQTIGRRRNPSGSAGVWILGILVIIVLIVVLSNNEKNRTSSQPARSTSALEITNLKLQVKELETQIKAMDERLESIDRTMNSYKSMNMINDYNLLVPVYNSLLTKRNAVAEQYRTLLAEVNFKIDQYNRESR